MKKFISFICIVLIISAILPIMASCEKSPVETDGKLKIVATLFPVYDFAKAIAGDRANVTMLIPPGTETHSYDPTPKDIINISECDMFLYVGKNMETWIDKIISSIPETVKTVDASANIQLISEDSSGHDEHFGLDPHVFTDPTLVIKMAEEIKAALIKLDPAGTEYYTERCKTFSSALTTLDNDFYMAIYGTSETICFGGRFSMRYFAKHYNLIVKCPYTSCGDETEPSPREITEVIDYMKENKVKYLFGEELSVSSVALTIAEETETEILPFYSCHNVSKDDFEAGVTYLDLMQKNLANIKKALG
ncbi:MAG: metal ABC transporter substrate-binding protein [Clostridia bacterium]